MKYYIVRLTDQELCEYGKIKIILPSYLDSNQYQLLDTAKTSKEADKKYAKIMKGETK